MLETTNMITSRADRAGVKICSGGWQLSPARCLRSARTGGPRSAGALHRISRGVHRRHPAGARVRSGRAGVVHSGYATPSSEAVASVCSGDCIVGSRGTGSRRGRPAGASAAIAERCAPVPAARLSLREVVLHPIFSSSPQSSRSRSSSASVGSIPDRRLTLIRTAGGLESSLAAAATASRVAASRGARRLRGRLGFASF